MVNDADGMEYPSRGVYTGIDQPDTLARIEPDIGVTTHSTFIDFGGGRTEVHIVQTNVPAMFRTPEAQTGMASSCERFAGAIVKTCE